MALHFFSRLIRRLNLAFGRDLESRKKSLKDKAELKQQKAIDSARLSYEVELLNIRLSEQLNRIKEREQSTTRDYKEFLDMIDDMKGQIVDAYPEMPKVMALVIHQHAKQLIDDMWNNPDENTQNQCRAKLTQFIKIVYDDTAQVLIGSEKFKIPSKTLEHIEKNKDDNTKIG